jgi:FkbM family methyltransferase
MQDSIRIVYSSWPHDFAMDAALFLEENRELNKEILEVLDKYLFSENSRLLGDVGVGKIHLKGIGLIDFPFYSLGKVKSYFHLEYRELVLFCMYRKLNHLYTHYLDIGGNIGLHSIITAKASNCDISFFEPDPIHFEEAKRRFEANNILSRVKMFNYAISDFEGKSRFVRVKDNTTASHLSGAKSSPYGPLEDLMVDVSTLDLQIRVDEHTLGKIDIEGSEARALSSVSPRKWGYFDAFVEVTDTKNAIEIFELSRDLNLNVLSQKISWGVVKNVEEMPINYKEGSIFISRNLHTKDLLS